MLRMSKAGKTQKEIAAKFDLCVRTVSYHIGLAKRGVTLARKTSPKGVNREKHPPSDKIGRAHVWTPVTNAHIVCSLLLEKKKKNSHHYSEHQSNYNTTN